MTDNNGSVVTSMLSIPRTVRLRYYFVQCKNGALQTLPMVVGWFFFCCTLHIKLWGIYCLGLFIVVYTHVVFMSCCRKCVMYVCQLSLLIWASYRHFKERLPEAICCCLQTCNVDVVLLVMYIPAFIVTSADISQLWVYLCYLLIYCLRLFVVVYKLVMFMECRWHCIAYVYKLSWSLVLTPGSYRYF